MTDVRALMRPASIDDSPAIAALLTRCRQRYLGRASSIAEATQHLAQPGSDPRLDTVVAVADDGHISGFGRVWLAEEAEVKCFVRVDPDATGRGIGTALLAQLERRAAELAREPQTELTLTHWAADAAAPALLRARGFVESRFYLAMVVDLAGTQVAVPQLPDGVAVRIFEPGDEAELFEAFRDAFASHPGRVDKDSATWWRERRDNESAAFDPGLWLLAVDGATIVGFSLGLERVDAGARAGYVGDVGVRAAWRGRGIGHALLARSLAEFQRRGLATAALDVDAENLSGALALYRKVGMEPRPAFTIWTKPIGRS